MACQERFDRRDIFLFLQGVHRYKFFVKIAEESMVWVINVSDAAAHSRGEILADFSQDESRSYRHILAPMVSAAFRDRDGSGISDAKPLSGDSVYIRFPRRGSVERDVPDYDIFLGRKRAVGRNPYYQLSSGKSFSEIIVAIAFKFKSKTLWNSTCF